MIAVLCALAAAVSNAVGTVMQRKAARQVPERDTMRLALVRDLMRLPVWYAGIGGMIGGFLLQATALSTGGLALVQPLIAVELPITLLIGAKVFRRRIDRNAMLGILAVSGGLALLVVATDPANGHQPDTLWPWVWACVITIAVGGGLVLGGLAVRGGPRAALFGAASGLAFGFTATLMKGALDQLSHGIGAVLTSWQPYAMIVAGVTGFFLTQNAFQSGPLVAAQPAITTFEPLTSILYGVLLFHESVRAGPWLIPTVIGGISGVVGSVLVARSPLSTAGADQPSEAEPTPNSGL